MTYPIIYIDIYCEANAIAIQLLTEKSGKTSSRSPTSNRLIAYLIMRAIAELFVGNVPCCHLVAFLVEQLGSGLQTARPGNWVTLVSLR